MSKEVSRIQEYHLTHQGWQEFLIPEDAQPLSVVPDQWGLTLYVAASPSKAKVRHFYVAETGEDIGAAMKLDVNDCAFIGSVIHTNPLYGSVRHVFEVFVHDSPRSTG